jgi:hypothetical protein
MVDSVLVDGDMVIFHSNFGIALVIAPPGQLQAQGKTTINNKKVCIEGDEKNVSVNATYTAGPYTIPGVGLLTIESLAPNQKTTTETDSGRALLLKGGQFTAKFQVTTPAHVPSPTSTTDATPIYMGNGEFIATNFRYMAA